MKRPQAFTLIEMLLVVVMIAILAAAVVPNFVKGYGPFQLRQSADDLKNGARWAQAMAMGQQRVYALSFSDDRRAYAFLRAVENSDPLGFEPVQIRAGHPRRIPPDMNLETESGLIKFYPDGTIDTAQVTLRQGEHKVVLSSAMMRGVFVIVDNP